MNDQARTKSFFRYVTCSEEDEKWQIVCTDAGHNQIDPNVAYPPNKESHPNLFKSVAVGRTLNEYQIIYITSGRGLFQTEEREYAVTPGTVMIVFPGMEHRYRPDYDVGWTEYWVGFRGSYAESLCRAGFLSPTRPVFRLGLQNSILTIFNQIFELVSNQAPLYQIRASSQILVLIAEILAFERGAVQHGHSQRLVERMKFYMEENIYGEINLNKMAGMLGVSSSHLNEAFKAYTSMTPYQYFISIKIHKAKELIDSGELSIKEIAYRLGFKDQYYFSRLFKKKTGITPSRWNPSIPEEV